MEVACFVLGIKTNIPSASVAPPLQGLVAKNLQWLTQSRDPALSVQQTCAHGVFWMLQPVKSGLSLAWKQALAPEIAGQCVNCKSQTLPCSSPES